MSRPILHAGNPSSCSWRVRIALYYKGIPHDVKVVKQNETRTVDYLTKVNPAGQVPVLQVDDNFISESIAIMEYLEEAYPQRPLIPKDPIQRAKVRQICELVASGIQPLQNPRVAEFHSDDPVKQQEWTSHFLHKGFTALEKVLQTTSSSGKFSVGDSLTTADCCLVPQVYNALARFNVSMEAYPQTISIYEALLGIEEVSRGHPDKPFP